MLNPTSLEGLLPITYLDFDEALRWLIAGWYVTQQVPSGRGVFWASRDQKVYVDTEVMRELIPYLKSIPSYLYGDPAFAIDFDKVAITVRLKDNV